MFLFVRSRTRGGTFRLTSTNAQALSEQLLEMPLYGAVALARGGLQARAVENGHVAIRVMDQASLLHGAGGDSHAGPSDAKHQRHELMRHRELVTVGTIMRHQQPAGQTLFKGMVTIAHGRL